MFAVKEGMVMVSQETDMADLVVEVEFDNFTTEFATGDKPRVGLFDSTMCDSSKLTKEKAS